MAQTTSSGWNSVVNSSYRQLTTGVLMSWLKTLASGIQYFTINSSLIEGNDILKGGGSSVSFFDKYNYVDYAQYAKNWSVDRQIGQFPFGMIMAQADVELDNSSKKFLPGYDPTIASGILPNRPLKINLGFNQDSLTIFTGYTGQPQLSIRDRNVTLHAYDVMDYINNYSFVSTSGTTFSGMQINVTTASAIAYYLGKLGFNTSQYSLDPSLQDPIGFVNVTDRKFGDVLNDLVNAEQAIMFSDENGLPTFWNRQHFNTSSGLGVKFNFDYSNAVDIQYANAPIINDVIVKASPRAVKPFQQVYKQGDSQVINAGQSIEIFATFTDDDGELPVLSVVAPTYSATVVNTSYFSANTASDGSGTAKPTALTISNTYLFGTSYKMTVTNTDSVDVYITAMEIYGNPAKVTQHISERYKDNSSIDKYGHNPANNGEALEIANDYIQSSSDAQSLAFAIVSQYSAPNRHFTVEVFSHPELQIGDFGYLTIPDTNEIKRVWITGKTDKLAPEGNLTQVLSLEERTLFTYFTINSSTIEGTDVIAP